MQLLNSSLYEAYLAYAFTGNPLSVPGQLASVLAHSLVDVLAKLMHHGVPDAAGGGGASKGADGDDGGDDGDDDDGDDGDDGNEDGDGDEVERAASSEYGAGASKYSSDAMAEWRRVGVAAQAKYREKDWRSASGLAARLVRLRPDWTRGWLLMAKCAAPPSASVRQLVRQEELLREGMAACRSSLDYDLLVQASPRIVYFPSAGRCSVSHRPMVSK